MKFGAAAASGRALNARLDQGPSGRGFAAPEKAMTIVGVDCAKSSAAANSATAPANAENPFFETMDIPPEGNATLRFHYRGKARITAMRV